MKSRFPQQSRDVHLQKLITSLGYGDQVGGALVPCFSLTERLKRRNLGVVTRQSSRSAPFSTRIAAARAAVPDRGRAVLHRKTGELAVDPNLAVKRTGWMPLLGRISGRISIIVRTPIIVLSVLVSDLVLVVDDVPTLAGQT